MTPQIASFLFLNPRRKEPAPESPDAFIPPAHSFSFRVGGKIVRGTVYGAQGKTALLVHGWESRGSHLSGFVPRLMHEGFRVAVFDAPAHGDSEGSMTTVGEFGQAVLLCEEAVGKIDAIIAHSAGSPAALYAISQGLEVQASVHIAGPISFERVLQRHAAICGLDQDGFREFRALVRRELGFDPELLEEGAVTRNLSHAGLLLHDPQDKEVPFDESSRLHRRWPNSRLHAVEGLGHRRIIQSDAVIEEAAAFLKKTLGQAHGELK